MGFCLYSKVRAPSCAMMLQAAHLGAHGKQLLQESLALHNQLRVIGAIESGEVDVGPLLGRGAFGRVYKGGQ